MFSEDFESFVTNLIFLLQLRVVSDSGKLLLRRRRRQHWAELRLRLQRSWMFRSSGSSRTRLHARTYRDTHTHALFSHMYRHLRTRTTDTLAGEHAHTYTVSLFPLTSALTQHRVYETHAHNLSLSLSVCFSHESTLFFPLTCFQRSLAASHRYFGSSTLASWL